MLWNKYWVNTLSSSSLLTVSQLMLKCFSRKFASGFILEVKFMNLLLILGFSACIFVKPNLSGHELFSLIVVIDK